MRFYLFLTIILIGGILAAAGAQAFVSHSANVDKENGYAILKPPGGSALVTKANAYAILQTPSGAKVSKVNMYAILKTNANSALVSKVNMYAIITKSIPSVQIIQ
jgi:hypothetical protein